MRRLRRRLFCPRNRHRWAAPYARSSFRTCIDCPEIGFWVSAP